MGTEFEDALCGNRAGLLKLKSAIDEALTSGESSSVAPDLSRVVLFNEDQLDSIQPEKPGSIARAFTWLVGILFIAVFVVGISNIVLSAWSVL